MQPNGKPHALALHPISSIVHGGASETTRKTNFSWRKITDHTIASHYIYLQDNLWRDAIDEQFIHLASDLKQPKEYRKEV